MINKMNHEQYVHTCKRQISNIAKQILENKINILEGCHFIYNNWHVAELSEENEEYRFIAHIDDEFDELNNFNNKNLLKKELDELRFKIENYYLNDIQNVCKKIIEHCKL